MDCLVNCIRTAHVVNTLITLHLYIRDNELRVKTNEFKLNRIVCRVTRSCSQRIHRLFQERIKDQILSNSFFPRTVREWNLLPASTVPHTFSIRHVYCIVLTLRRLCTTTTPSFVELRTFSQEPSSVYGKRRRIQHYMLPVPVHIRLNRRYM